MSSSSDRPWRRPPPSSPPPRRRPARTSSARPRSGPSTSKSRPRSTRRCSRPPRRLRPRRAPPPAPPPRDKRDSERNLFGTEFPWAQGDFSAEGKTYKKVGLRYAGRDHLLRVGPGPEAAAEDRVQQVRRPAVPRPHVAPAPRDAAGPREGPRGPGLLPLPGGRRPAPRTAFAEVTLTVPGKYDKEYLGLYTVVENVDRPFLEDRFGTDKGLLMKPFQVRSLDYLGDDWERYQGQYRPQSEPTKDEAKRVIAFAKLVNQAERRRVQEGDRLVPRRGRVPALPGRQRPDVEPGKLLRPRPQLLTCISTRRPTGSSSSPATWNSRWPTSC